MISEVLDPLLVRVAEYPSVKSWGARPGRQVASVREVLLRPYPPAELCGLPKKQQTAANLTLV